MRPEDVAVWDKFIRAYGRQFDGFDYDYLVGDGRANPFPPGSERSGLYQSLTQYRIDAVGYRLGAVWTIEVKQDATPEALGQALAYATLFPRHIADGRTIVPVVVSDSCRPDTREVFRAAGVELFCMDTGSALAATTDISGA